MNWIQSLTKAIQYIESNLTHEFTYLYSEKVGNPEGLQCDSGVTNYFFAPQFVKKAYAAFG